MHVSVCVHVHGETTMGGNDTAMPAELQEGWRAAGLWADESLGQAMARAAREGRNKASLERGRAMCKPRTGTPMAGCRNTTRKPPNTLACNKW